MERWVGKTAVVTGASGGIGAAIAVVLANNGMKVVGLARRPHLIDNLRSQVTGTGSIVSRQCDVSKAEDLKTTFTWIEEHCGGVDVMVNNAAILIQGYITESRDFSLTEEELSLHLDTNIRGAMLCVRHATTSMNKRGVNGHVININSVAGHYIPSSCIFNVYTSTKHAITAFTKSLQVELASFKSRIKTTSISPGLVATDMAANSRFPAAAEAIKHIPILAAKDVADAVLYVISTSAHVNISELTIQPVGETLL